jgi:NAD(P)-dependent dehydrogenase (short-subunit alcohol dehydrogenase family)
MGVNGLKGQVAIVTAASGGLGRATVQLFVESGASVVAEDIDAAVNELAGERVAVVVGDVRRGSTAEQAVRCALDRFGGINILVNNAAMILSKNIVATSETEWDELMSVNVKGAFLHLRAVLPIMLERGSARSSASRRFPGLSALRTNPHIAPRKGH